MSFFLLQNLESSVPKGQPVTIILSSGATVAGNLESVDAVDGIVVLKGEYGTHSWAPADPGPGGVIRYSEDTRVLCGNHIAGFGC
jgi:hypothetical protein